MPLKDYFDSTLAAARAGAAWAWENIYKDLAGPLGGYFRGNGVADPEDLVSETFLSIARDIHRFSGDEHGFRAWAFTIAHRRLQDHWRAKGREVAIAESEHASREAERQWLGDVEDEAMGAMSLLEVEVLVAHLNKAQREVLMLRVVGDLSVAETAQVMDRSEGSVRVLQTRALKALREKLPDAVKRLRTGERSRD